MRLNYIFAAALFAGPMVQGRSAEAAPSANMVRIGEVRSISGAVSATQVDGMSARLQVGDPLYLNDLVETNAASTIGAVLNDGTTVALGENGELIFDKFIYDPKTRRGNAVISLISGFAEFISGQIAKSGPDHMQFKTPVATIGVRGTKVFLSYGTESGTVTIINRPTHSDTRRGATAGGIFLYLPDGTPVGPITAANGSWQWRQRHAPMTVQLTEAQARDVAAPVENIVDALAPYLS